MTLLMGQYFYHKHVRMYRPSGLGTMQEEKVVQNLEDDEEGEEVEQTETGKKMSRRDAEMKDNGQSLYSALHLLYYTGFYRILPSYDFKYELLVGYAIEILISLIPMFFC
jgi:vacuolar-type H+-ATPase subunit C/Vma6